MKVLISRNEWIRAGVEKKWLKVSQAVPPYRTDEARSIDEAIRHLNTFREKGSITAPQFHEQMGRLKKKIEAFPDKADRAALMDLFNPSYFDKIVDQV